MKHQLRINGWEMRLDSLLNSRRMAPFQWGLQDCVLFAADAVLAITGVDHAAGFRGMSAKSSYRYLRAHGGIEALASRVLGCPSAPGDAREGDIVLMRVGKRHALAVCMGPKLAVGPTALGLAWLPMEDDLTSWRVG